MSSPLDHARVLLARARDDEYVVRRLLGESDAPVWVLGFHAQQAVEKALKAVLSSAGSEYPRTHNLAMLVELVRRAGRHLPPDAEEFGGLVPFGAAMRYDEFGLGEPPRIDAARLEGMVARTLAWADASLSETDR